MSNKICFVIKTFLTAPEREKGEHPMARLTANTLAEFDEIVRENDGKYLAFESAAGVKMTWQGCRFILDKQGKEAEDV